MWQSGIVVLNGIAQYVQHLTEVIILARTFPIFHSNIDRF